MPWLIQEPTKPALFYWYKHLQTDELLGAWLFLIATGIPLYVCMYYFAYEFVITALVALFVLLSASSALHVGVFHAESVVFLLFGLVRRGGVCVRQLSLRSLLLSKRKGYNTTYR